MGLLMVFYKFKIEMRVRLEATSEEEMKSREELSSVFGWAILSTAASLFGFINTSLWDFNLFDLMID